MSNPIAAALIIARRLVTVPPPRVNVTVDELGVALHAVQNDGRIARYGAAYCKHPEIAEKVLAYLEQERTG